MNGFQFEAGIVPVFFDKFDAVFMKFFLSKRKNEENFWSIGGFHFSGNRKVGAPLSLYVSPKHCYELFLCCESMV